MVRGDILNNPNEGDKFAYWGEGGDAFGPGLAVLRDWSRTSRLHASRAILIAGNEGSRGAGKTLVRRRGEAAVQDNRRPGNAGVRHIAHDRIGISR